MEIYCIYYDIEILDYNICNILNIFDLFFVNVVGNF